MSRRTWFTCLALAALFQTAQVGAQNLPEDTSTLFSGSGKCVTCHRAATGVLLNSSGVDLSPPTTWRSTMMANAARDPLWRAKVSTEIEENPALQSIIEDKCATCHAPMARTEAVQTGTEYYSMAAMELDPLALDGVSCTLCHQIRDENLGEAASFTGGFVISDARQIFGPYVDPDTAVMKSNVNYTAKHSDHVGRSELCATCHTVYTRYVDNSGTVLGLFPEQTAYLEWKNSIYGRMSIDCQDCHMPVVNESMKISTFGPAPDTLRRPVWKHDFVGGNSFMLSLLNDNLAELGVTAEAANFDSTVSKAVDMLRNHTVELTADAKISGDTLAVDVTVNNLAGHKFPTGFPSRRAWIRLTVTDEQDQTFFQSGGWDSAFEITGLDSAYEPHHDYVYSADEVPVYESVMADPDGNQTYVLLRGSHYVKDNRLPPKGFELDAEDYDDMRIAGAAATDPDFNEEIFGGGRSGGDIVHYRLPLNETIGLIDISVEIYYQSVSPCFLNNLFDYDIAEVNSFETLYNAAENTPQLVKSVSLDLLVSSVERQEQETKPASFALAQNFPNPFNPETTIAFDLADDCRVQLRVYNINGQLVRTLVDGRLIAGGHRVRWDGQDQAGRQLGSGIYLYRIQAGQFSRTRRMVLLK